MRHINYSVLKDTLWLKILRTWIKIRANYFIKTLVNNMKRKINEGALNIITCEKNATPHFKEHYTKIDISLVVICFFFSQTNLVFKYNPLFIDILDSFCHSLFTFYLLIFNFIIRICQFIQCLYAFFIKTSKVLINQCSFCKVIILKMLLCHVLLSMKKYYLLTWSCC